MFASLKSEFRKLLTIRSTYIITGFTLALVAFLGVYVFGYQQSANDAKVVLDTGLMKTALFTAFGVFATTASIVAILSVTHEYRYNLINYTLTAAKSRLVVFLNKTLVALLYTIVVGVIVTAVMYLGMKLGLSIKGNTLITQDFPVADAVWQFGSYVIGMVLFALLIAFLVRGVVGAIVAFFLIPVVEQMLTLVLKDNADYLPFKALDAIASDGMLGSPISSLTSLTALGVVAVYLAVIGTITAVLFIKRDASS